MELKARRRLLLAAAGIWLALVFAWSAPGTARAADCSLDDQTYNGACGTGFELPAWGDGGGWTDPSKYTTIQFADLTGNGVDDLIGRNDAGIEIWRFDKSVGQWRPAVGPDGLPQVLRDFHSPAPSDSGPNWNQAQYYKTIQTADLNGDGADEIIARFPDGIHVYGYKPPAGTKNIDGGTWSLLSSNGPFSDADGFTDPSLYLSIHALPANPKTHSPGYLVAQTRSDLSVYKWTGSGWTAQDVPQPAGYQHTGTESEYLNITPVANLLSDYSPSIMTYQNEAGLSGLQLTGGKWQPVGFKPPSGYRPFSSLTACAPDCFDGSPSYYTTLRYADVDGSSGVDVLGRLKDGLHVYKLSADGSTWNLGGQTLTDLKGSIADLQSTPGRWASIRSGDILGNGRDQVLALDGSALQTWSYDPNAKSWTKLSPAQPLKLGGDLWDKHPEYYSTIRVGDVTGDGHAAVIARGPYGIRTWFYNLHGNSGWTNYLPQDAASSYPQFTGTQLAAFNALTQQAIQHGAIGRDDKSVRDEWTAENAPSDSDLSTLKQSILAFAGCPGGTAGTPPFPDKSCVPPNPNGFGAADWTAVINEVMSEIGSADTVVKFFTTLDELRQHTFIAHGAELTAIATKLGLQGETDNETGIRPSEIAGTTLKILGALAEEVPGVGQALDIAGELVGLLGSESKTFNSELPRKYADLANEFAVIITEMDKALQVQSQEVRQSYGLLKLVAELNASNGAWRSPDLIGLESASDQGFAVWAYKQLLPTVYARYTIDNCRWRNYSTNGHYKPLCVLTGVGPESIGSDADDHFVTIGYPPADPGPFDATTPCNTHILAPPTGTCVFQALNLDISTRVWGPVADTCQYKPGDAKTKWTFGCNLGVAKYRSVDMAGGTAEGWDFASYCHDYKTDVLDQPHPCSAATARASVGAHGRLTLGGKFRLPRGFRVKSAAIPANGLLYETAGPRHPITATPGMTLNVVHTSAHGVRMALAARARPGATLTLAPIAQRRLSYSLAVGNVNLGIPSACRAVPPSDALRTPPVQLTTTILLNNGADTIRAKVAGIWRCVRDRTGTITRLLPVRPPRLPQRPGLAISVSGPRRVVSGHTAIYLVRVSNRRRRPRNRIRSSLWHVLVRGSLRAESATASTSLNQTSHIKELRRGRSHILRVTVHVPRAARGRACFAASAFADSARPAFARTCSRVHHEDTDPARDLSIPMAIRGLPLAR